MGPRRRFRTFVVILLAFLPLAVLCLTPPRPAAAFKLGPHETIVRTALGSLGIPPSEMTLIVGSLLDGTGNRGSDAFQFDEYRHFDNAVGPAQICARAQAAWNRFYVEMRQAVQPRNPPEYDVISGESLTALQSFGALTHSLQDFYAHSNWIELFLANGQSPPLASGLFPPPCNSASLPAAIQTGYFNLANGLDGCPGTGPPAGFNGWCHETLNKDQNSSPEGRKIVPGGGMTYHELAMQLAIAHTTQLYHLVVQSLIRDWTTDYPDVRADCLVRQLFQHVIAPCRFGHIVFANLSPSVHLGGGTVSLRNAAGQQVEEFSPTGWPSAPLQTHSCLPGMSITFDFAVQDKTPPPVARHVQGAAALTGNGCDASVSVDPRSKLDYVLRFTSTESVLPGYTQVDVVVNGGTLVPAGPVPAGASVWVDLGPCSTVATFDFVIKFVNPTGTPLTATPDPPPFAANATCNDDIKFSDLGRQLYGHP
jgi:hypothetical protein